MPNNSQHAAADSALGVLRLDVILSNIYVDSQYDLILSQSIEVSLFMFLYSSPNHLPKSSLIGRGGGPGGYGTPCHTDGADQAEVFTFTYKLESVAKHQKTYLFRRLDFILVNLLLIFALSNFALVCCPHVAVLAVRFGKSPSTVEPVRLRSSLL